MDQLEHQPDVEELTAGGVATDAATLNSDAAVGGSVGGGSGERRRGSSAAAAAATVDGAGGTITDSLGATDAPAAVSAVGGRGINAHARQRHYRKRALSTAKSFGTIETMEPSSDAANGHLSGVSLMNSSTIGSNMMSSGAEHSIVSFGLNFNFDSTSSPSNSDSGEAVNDGKGGGDAGSSGEDDNNGNKVQAKNKGTVLDGARCLGAIKTKSGEEKKKKKAHDEKHRAEKAAKTPSPENKKEGGKDSGGSNEGKNSKNGKGKKHTSVKFDANAAAAAATTGEEGSGSSTSSGSDSSMNNDSGGSASGGSNSGNDGSSGGKSTISSLTTSSNQEWMAANESAAAAEDAAANIASGVEAKSSGAGGKAVGENGATDPATKKKDTQSGKKRKKVKIAEDTKNTSGGGNGGGGGGEDDDGYKTDEEQWGGNRTGEKGQGVSMPIMATHKGPSLLKGPSSKKSAPEGPPLKQARFSIDQGHPEAVQSADASAQPLSSLSGSDSAGVPAVSSSSGAQTNPRLSNSSATAAATSSNPSNSSGPTPQRNVSLANPGKRKVQGGGGQELDKRKERNAREKERSCRIAQQIDDLRNLLSRGGVIVSKGTKSSVLSEAATYINLLQQQQVQWEMDRQALLQQMQQIGANPNGMVQNQLPNEMSMIPAAADAQAQQLQPMEAIPQGGIPGQALPMNPLGQQPTQNVANSINHNDYKFIFDNSSVGMAIASLGGAFVDCNSIFCQLSEFTMEEVTSMTIFNMTSRQDLQHAFDLISQMITPTLDNTVCDKGDDKSSIVLRGAMKKRSDLGLSISLIKGDNGVAKCFCVTLVRILSMEATRPDTVSIEMELPQVWSTKQQKNVGFGASPAYTSG